MESKNNKIQSKLNHQKINAIGISEKKRLKIFKKAVGVKRVSIVLYTYEIKMSFQELLLMCTLVKIGFLPGYCCNI